MKIQLQNLTKKFPNRNKKAQGDVIAVDHFTYEIPDGKLIGLLGPSGCGKSTTLNLICGLEKPTEGQIFFGDRDVTKLPPEHRGVGMVFQNYALYPHLSVKQNILFPLENFKGEQKLSKSEMLERASQAAGLVQIEDLMDRKPSELSGGQQQRVAIARALVKMPHVLLLDEPLSNLDAKLRTAMRTEIIRLHQKLATTFIYVTHDQTEAMTMGDRIVVMKDGVVQQVDTPQNLYDFPCNMFVAGFIGSPQMNFLDATLQKEGDSYYVDLGGDKLLIDPAKVNDKLASYVGKAIKAGIRPEDIKDDEEFLAKHPASQLTAHVDVSELMGSEIYLYLEYKGYKMTARVSPASTAKSGSDVKVALDTKKLHLFDPETELAIMN